MIIISRTWLLQPVMLVMEEVFDFLIDDTPDLLFKNYEPRLTDDSRWYISRTEGGEVVGAFWCRRINCVTWEAHANVRPKYWGDGMGTAHCQAAIDLMFEDTGATKIVAICAECFPVVMKMTEAIGFVREGVQTGSFQRDGELYDQIHYGISRKTP